MSRNTGRSHSHPPDYVLWGAIGALLIFGLVMLSSAGSVLGFQRYDDANYFLKEQLVSVFIGLIGLTVLSRIDYHHWYKWSVPVFLLSVILLLILFFPGIGSLYLGARRWINLGFFTIQPSELAKLGMVIYLAAWVDRRQHSLKLARESLFPFLATVGLVVVLVLAQPDLGTATVIVATSFLMYFVAGAPLRHLAGLLVAGFSFLLIMIRIAPYRTQRFTVFLNPDLDPLGIGYHINQALLAIGTGGWLGLGLGRSRQKFNYLPEPAGDSIFAVTAEELGFLFTLIFITLWGFVIYRGLQIARAAPDRFGQLLATGIIIWLGLQAFINIGALSGLLPLTGIPLPFLSHGGSAMISNLAAIGILLNISRQTGRHA